MPFAPKFLFAVQYPYMSYQTYTTEALVCGVFDSNTADKSYLLFTKRAGMLYATARSVREERSKQRYALQLFSRITISLVRGKSGWRIGSVEALENQFLAAKTRVVRGSVVSVIKLVRQYIHGEEPMHALYDEVLQSIKFLAQLSDSADRPAFEALIKVRILAQLGYIAPTTDTLTTLITTPLGAIDPVVVSAYHEHCEQLLATTTQVSHLAAT